jgi:hypothetical protein
MSKTVSYKTYTIISCPLQQWATGRWEIGTSIVWERAGTMTTLPFSAKVTYTTEEEADIDGINYAQRIIDGQITELSLDEAA